MTENMMNDGGDGWFEQLVGKFALKMRREAAASLLAGNDMCCFTTEQYKEAYYRRERRTEQQQAGQKAYDTILGRDWGRMHLESIPEVVREVRPDVWAAVEVAP